MGSIEEEMVVCEFNKAHRISKSKYPYHLEKCRKHNQVPNLVKCTFNVTHLIPASEKKHHEQQCPDRFLVEKERYEANTGYIAISKDMHYRKPKLELESENNEWDNENVKPYNPEEHCVNNDIIRTIKHESAAVRRDFKFQERLRQQQLEWSSKPNSKPSNLLHEDPVAKTALKLENLNLNDASSSDDKLSSDEKITSKENDDTKDAKAEHIPKENAWIKAKSKKNKGKKQK